MGPAVFREGSGGLLSAYGSAVFWDGGFLSACVHAIVVPASKFLLRYLLPCDMIIIDRYAHIEKMKMSLAGQVRLIGQLLC